MKIVVVYKSKTGYVKRYAHWIAEELSADIYDESKITVDKLLKYDTIIYGAGLYAVGINGIKLITKNLNLLEGKNIIVFSTGASPNKEEVVDKVRNHNFTTESQEKMKFFYMRGGFNYDTLKPIDKVLMKLMKSVLIKKNKKNTITNDEKGMLDAYDNPVDYTSKENINELVQYVNGLNS